MRASAPDSSGAPVVKRRLVAAAGRLAQEFGFNRAAGEILGSLYLTAGSASLDELEAELGWSKAAVSLAAAQLERMGLVQRVRKPGDRKRYYRSAEDIGTALRDGILKFATARMAGLEAELQQATAALAAVKREPEARFLAARVNRLQDLNRRARRLLGNPLVRLFARLG
ncbi:MAG TPA: MarR family transcriptional regulator [Kiritimatiellia bacterium]|jgi:DNA-binding transcriptional regulator GbsR (MarR family)|nr:MarR family transcriptional regulator [Kiritimatiellia bacterium]OQC59815.1 MAG: MarR family protein [Verrucomicrobia bacterium ADurb.Bin018]MBP9571576.1 MarR family transcriptional regulator [Kiritimatiellia bacterium]HOE00690.1 MarR family transcriptional regulator [Kiritimatiellia bacterium]HOE36032.1 MarR family transcriptional regulator [Kiritimatiellia bacterium]